MNLLWLTLADPEPATNGQFIYSRGLIQGAVAAGAAVHVVALERPGPQRGDHPPSPRLSWAFAEHRPRTPCRGRLSRLPYMVSRVMTREMRSLVQAALDRASWDAVVFDSLAHAWALGPIIGRRWGPRGRPKLVYIAHNREAQLALQGVHDDARPLHRMVKRVDARRVVRLERALVEAADLVTANTPEDRQQFQAEHPGGPVIFLPPGYDGVRCRARTITADAPRRALIVGTFDWSTKRESLEAFLAVADRRFASAGIELVIVGSAEPAYLDRLRARVTATRFTGRVEEVAPYFGQGRIALVSDRHGGFKLKTLDYVFNRLPIAATAGAAPGLPLVPGESILLAHDHAGLAQIVIETIDDFDRLNRIQNAAYWACQDRFDWSAVGARLLAAID